MDERLSIERKIQKCFQSLRFVVRQQQASSARYLGALASLSLAVGQEAGEERQVDAVVQGQQEVVGQLEAGGILGQ